MSSELGFLSLLLALGCAVLQSFAAFRADEHSGALAISAARAQAIAALASFLFLLAAFAASDFSVANVAANSHSTKPVFYKIAAGWGNHEGSMLLWALLLSIYGAFFAHFQGRARPDERFAVGVLGLLSAGVLAFIALASNPFERLIPAVAEGQGLNPLLQDIGLIIHPPMLYLGYVGFAVPFAMAMGGLAKGKIDADWAKRTRPWMLIAWGFMTWGIVLGSWWAYRELGWGGYWFWDPVENASLLPWLVGAAMVHSTLVLERRGGFPGWTVLLAIITFSLSLIGTFIVRSGLLTSVHAFAVDPTRGLAILIYLTVSIGSALALFAMRSKSFEADIRFTPASREALILINNLVMSSAAAAIFLGTLYPLFIDAIGAAPLSVGAPFFAATAIPLFIIGMLAMGLAPLAMWRKGTIMQALGQSRFALGIALAGSALTIALKPGSFIGPLAVGAALWVGAGTLTYGAKRRKMKWTLDQWAMVMGHLGLAIAAIGMASTALFSTEVSKAVSPGEITQLGEVSARFDGISNIAGPNFTAERAQISLLDAQGKVVRTLYPERRFYPASGMPTTEAAIDSHFLGDLHVTVSALTEKEGQVTVIKGWAVRLFYRPLIGWIWVGAALTGLGSLIGGFGLGWRYRRRIPRVKPVSEAIS
ncbi:MAG: c-type cytochrome biogenesis protein CcmF [Robiginitomaculum sp.]|nr:MAG: c-type cytochrome biogenesis protein CcmF [Robiginitomaculum sp.]